MQVLVVPKIAELIERDKKAAAEKAGAEVATTNSLRQEMMANEGKLRPVIFVGPEQNVIHGYFSPEENAFLPKFTA
jgi:hypothetical protein